MPDMAGSSRFQEPCSQGGGPSGKDNLGNKKHHIKITARAREKKHEQNHCKCQGQRRKRHPHAALESTADIQHKSQSNY